MEIMKTIDKVEVGKRIRIARLRFPKKITHAQIGKHVGTSRNAVSNWELGKTNVDLQHQKSLADFLEVNLTWLLYGEGPMERGVEAKTEGTVITLVTEDKGHSDYMLIPKLKISGSVGPGIQNYEEGEIEKYLSFGLSWLNKKNCDKKSLRIISAKGDSMSPHIEHGDSVMVDTSKVELEDGEIFAFRVGDEVRIKRFRKKDDGRWYIISDNPDRYRHPDEPVNENINIIGKKIWRGG